MIKQTILGLGLFFSVFWPLTVETDGNLISPLAENRPVVLAEHQLDLRTRNKNPLVNEVFADNILLALHYFAGDGQKVKDNWEKIRQPFKFSLILQPEEVFVFHNDLLPEFRGERIKSSQTDYSVREGYRVVGGLSGNGVCHLASLMNWTAAEAGLEVVAKVNHNFHPIPGVPRQYGTSIRSLPKGTNSQRQNLYLKNPFAFPITFSFEVNGQLVNLKLLKY